MNHSLCDLLKLGTPCTQLVSQSGRIQLVPEDSETQMISFDSFETCNLKLRSEKVKLVGEISENKLILK